MSHPVSPHCYARTTHSWEIPTCSPGRRLFALPATPTVHMPREAEGTVDIAWPFRTDVGKSRRSIVDVAEVMRHREALEEFKQHFGNCLWTCCLINTP